MKSCLIVEDSAVIREITVRIVADLGLTVIEAETPQEAVEKSCTAKPDVVFLDWDLPSLGALDVLHGVGALENDPAPAVILMATENDPQQFVLAKAAGAAHHVLKPFDRDSIAAVLVEAGIIDAPATNEDRAVS